MNDQLLRVIIRLEAALTLLEQQLERTTAERDALRDDLAALRAESNGHVEQAEATA